MYLEWVAMHTETQLYKPYNEELFQLRGNYSLIFDEDPNEVKLRQKNASDEEKKYAIEHHLNMLPSIR